MSRRLLSALAFALVLAGPRPALAAQYEATLLPQRSLRYETSFGLFEDDFDAFLRPRYLNRWDGARLTTQLADIAPAGQASFGYGRAATGGWSWSFLASGGYRRSETYRSGQRLFVAGQADQLTSNFTGASSAAGEPAAQGAAQAAFGANRALGPGQLGLGVQARWLDERRRGLDAPPALFTLPSPLAQAGSGESSAADFDTGALFESQSFTRDPLTERRTFAAALLAGYAVRREGWGYAVDLLAGAELRRDAATFAAADAAQNGAGTAAQRYTTSSLTSGVSPTGGLALTFVHSGSHPLWIDLGGDFASGYSPSGERGRTTGERTASVDVGGYHRAYVLNEQRIDNVSGTLGARRSLTAGVRQSMALDALLQLGWGLHARYAAASDELAVASAYRVRESLDVTGQGRTAESTHSEAQGASRESSRADWHRVEVTAPLALMIRHAADAALEWRLGGEVRYTNTYAVTRGSVDSLSAPSGRRVSATQETSTIRYAGIDMPVGAAERTRDVAVNSALRAGVGYWFSPTAKIDAVVSGEPAGEGFVGVDKHSFGLSALLAF